MKCNQILVKKIGSLLSSILLSVSFCCASPTILLRTIDVNDEEITQAQVGTPFFIEVTIESANGNISMPEIKGFKSGIIEEKSHVSTINTIINGKRSVKKIYRFTAQIMQEGTFEIGPAYAQIEGDTVNSNVSRIAVVKQIARKPTEPFLQMIIDRPHVYVGEKIQCAIRFFLAKNIRLEGISQPAFPDFNAEKLEGPFPGKQDIDGVLREYVEWRTTLVPTKVGVVAIPAIAAIYKSPIERRSHSFFGFHPIFNDPFEQKQIYSNALQIQVNSLPELSNHVLPFAVGGFKMATLTVDPSQAKEGEGIVLRITVIGDGTILRFPELKLPNGLKYYESKQTIDEKKSSTADKAHVFEYIVQGIQPGNYTLGVQELLFFDPKQKSYRALHTQEASLSILALNGQKQKVESKEPQEQKSQKKEDKKEAIIESDIEKPEIKLYKDGWAEQAPFSIPLWIFAILNGMICLVAIFLSLLRLYRWYCIQFSSSIRSKGAYKKARVKLKQCINQKSSCELYDIFVQLFADRYNVPIQSIDERFIRNHVEKSFSDASMQERWHQFYVILMQIKFSDEKNKLSMQVYEDAAQWIDILEKYL